MLFNLRNQDVQRPISSSNVSQASTARASPIIRIQSAQEHRTEAASDRPPETRRIRTYPSVLRRLSAHIYPRRWSASGRSRGRSPHILRREHSWLPRRPSMSQAQRQAETDALMTEENDKDAYKYASANQRLPNEIDKCAEELKCMDDAIQRPEGGIAKRRRDDESEDDDYEEGNGNDAEKWIPRRVGRLLKRCRLWKDKWNEDH